MTTQADQRNGLTDKVKRGQEEVRGLGHEVGDIASEFRELGRLELELAQAEIREQAGHVTRAALFGAITGVLVGVLAVFIFVTLWSVLDSFMAEWLAALITTLAVLASAAATGYMAMTYVKRFSPLPRRAMNSIREDIRWAIQQTKSSSV